ncbi:MULTISPECIES: hypothetical protein [Eubacterium]|uniref:hypothetical protein n=1 Tax=Eubacterium TaxID=1730 RepID=UPI00131473E3|nr:MULTISPECIES: hypothetical protein [Eubacterium]
MIQAAAAGRFQSNVQRTFVPELSTFHFQLSTAKASLLQFTASRSFSSLPFSAVCCYFIITQRSLNSV